MSKLSMILSSAAAGALFCGTVGALVAGWSARGTSVALPGLGLVVAGPLAAGVAGTVSGAVIGLAIGLLVGAAIALKRG